MKSKIILSIALILAFMSVSAQKGKITGIIRDAITSETIPGVNIVYAEGKGTTTDINGYFSINNLPAGEYNISVSYVGYVTQKTVIKIINGTVVLDFNLSTVTLSEVEVVSDIAKTRETPVAFVNILPAKLQEELGSQDLPMILNTTPGVYATQQGGGDGDARINIRGFSQRNVAVMIDGIPVNDMENGWVYWSNWFGLDAVTRSVQVQRGLGASKLAIPSVGGTMNILTTGISSKKEISLKQEVGSDNYLRTTLSYNSGKLPHGWGVTLAGSYKYNSGYVDMTTSSGWFYYLKIDKTLGKHILSVTASGAPQKHGQRPFKEGIATYDMSKARELGIDSFPPKYYGLGTKYNQNWGNLDRYTTEDGVKKHNNLEQLTASLNYFHKPQFTIRDFWNVNDKLYVSNIVYLSVGSGGGTGAWNSIGESDLDAFGQINWQKFYDANLGPFSINPMYSTRDHLSSQIIKTSVNNHLWYGLLSTVNYNISKVFDLSAGIDLRSYKGSHYDEIYDLLGGDAFVKSPAPGSGDYNRNPRTLLCEGSKISYNYDGVVRWGGAFVQGQMKYGRFSAFINVSGAYSGYRKIDYFAKKVVKVGDSTIEVGYNDTVNYNGVTYDRNSADLKYQQSDWKWIPSYTIKGGLNFNISETSNIFANLGYLTKAHDFKYIYERNSIALLPDIRNEVVKAIELGYSLNLKKLAVNVNGYYTAWQNKAIDPIRTKVADVEVTGDIPGIDALHIGGELELMWKIIPSLELQGLVSYGDWKWTSIVKNVILFDNNNKALDTIDFDARGVHVDDAAQTQYGASLRFEPLKGLYVKGQFTYFDRYYSQLDPSSLSSANGKDENGNPRDSWKIPAYYIFDLHAGYSFKVNKLRYSIRFSVFNLLDNTYIAEAKNNDSYNNPSFNDFDAKSASVFFGLGRRYNATFQVTF
jgi:outer membrane receptor for ferrienterochelin and colicin